MRFACTWMTLIAAAALAACGGDDDGDGGEIVVTPDTAASGSRLKLGWFELEGGLRTWSGEIHDSKLGLPCKPTEWHDGTLRCTPADLPQLYYADAGCTQPLILDDQTMAVTTYSDCDGQKPDRLFVATGDESMVAEAYELSIEGCYVARRDARARHAREQSPPDLVELTRVYEGEGRVQIETLTSRDGLILPVQPYDTQLHAACKNFDNIVFNTDGMADTTSVPCVLDVVETEDFADATCETPALVERVPACEPPPMIAELGAGPCRPYFAVDDTPEPDAYFELGACLHLDPIPEARIFGGTSRLETVTFARDVQAGEGRLQRIYLSNGDARIREREVFYDTALETECALWQLDIDDWVCRPVSRSTATEQLFTDDQCTQRVDVTLIADADDALWPCMSYKPRKYSVGANDELRPIGDVQPGPLYGWVSGTCRLVEITNATPHALGAPVTTPFVHATKVFE